MTRLRIVPVRLWGRWCGYYGRYDWRDRWWCLWRTCWYPNVSSRFSVVDDWWTYWLHPLRWLWFSSEHVEYLLKHVAYHYQPASLHPLRYTVPNKFNDLRIKNIPSQYRFSISPLNIASQYHPSISPPTQLRPRPFSRLKCERKNQPSLLVRAQRFIYSSLYNSCTTSVCNLLNHGEQTLHKIQYNLPMQ
jgi:hypothetical protein